MPLEGWVCADFSLFFRYSLFFLIPQSYNYFRLMVSGTCLVSLHAHLHGYRRVWIISLYYNIIVLKLVHVINVARKTDRGERFWLSLELCLERLDVVLVDVGVSELDDELARLSTGDMCDHVGEQRI